MVDIWVLTFSALLVVRKFEVIPIDGGTILSGCFILGLPHFRRPYTVNPFGRLRTDSAHAGECIRHVLIIKTSQLSFEKKRYGRCTWLPSKSHFSDTCMNLAALTHAVA